jgi:uncharacterized protein
MADILVVGLSARALAQSARAAGYAPLAADLFLDLDTEEAAERSARIEGELESGLSWDATIAALETLAEGREPIGIVCGSGFEDRPHFLERLATRWPLIGNPSETVTRAKSPAALSETCAKLGVPHPAWSERPRDGWLRKRAGGSGGSHVADAASGDSERDYWQEPVAGEPVSALVLGSEEQVLVLGFSSQWADPTPAAPFRYGGAARPAALNEDMRSELSGAARAVAQELQLIGLNSIDFLVGDADWRLVEVNPRPGAVMDIFRPAEGSLLGLHVEACLGRLPAQPPKFSDADAAAIVYAERAIAKMPAMGWPEWAADRQRPDTSVLADAPLCTVRATADTAEEARRLVLGRAAEMRAMIEATA